MKKIKLMITWTKTACHEYDVDVPDNWDDRTEKQQVEYVGNEYHDDPPHDCYGQGYVTELE